MRKICVVTGSRAEYGLLSRLMRLIKEDPTLTLQIIATNMHLSPEFGHTYKEIEKDGFQIDRKVEMLLSSDTANATTKSVGLATIGFADAYEDLKPDLLLVLGDRYEILAAVTAALFYKIPVAHLHGGEITEGAYDDAIRHAITKMSHLHFTSTGTYRKRVIQLGEDPNRVFNVGSIGIDNIMHLQLLSKNELEESLNFQFGEKCVLVTFHPVTLESNTAEEQIDNLLYALESIDDLRIIFTLPNSDTNGRVIVNRINQFVEKNRNRSIAFASLGQIRYLSVMQFINAVIGNSSSGIIETPSFGIPTLNIGARQQGRLRADSVIDCDPNRKEIKEKLNIVLSASFKEKCATILNPYQKDNTVMEILSSLKESNFRMLLMKKFFNI
jgi:UDP-N-acetylglucosamine 2-epimerase (non-hydrolysing)/GDP/UDP-N,N'-diacetylbacillosamine 2-epimerase (hydrolysing)